MKKNCFNLHVETCAKVNRELLFKRSALVQYWCVKLFCIYSETNLNQTSLVPTSVFKIDRFEDYTGQINKDFLHWDFFI